MLLNNNKLLHCIRLVDYTKAASLLLLENNSENIDRGQVCPCPTVTPKVLLPSAHPPPPLHLIRGSLGPSQESSLKQHQDRFIRFSTADGRDQQTYR